MNHDNPPLLAAAQADLLALRWDRGCGRVAAGFRTPLAPTPLPDLYLVACSPAAAALIGLNPSDFDRSALVEAPAGNLAWPIAEPLDAACSDRRYNVCVPRRGDGRVILLGDVVGPDGGFWALQLKGCRKTPCSRMGDGRTVLRGPPHPCLALLEQVARRTARLVARWLPVGICQGAKNADHMSILGLTIDYGSFGFIDAFDAPAVACRARLRREASADAERAVRTNRVSAKCMLRTTFWRSHPAGRAAMTARADSARSHVCSRCCGNRTTSRPSSSRMPSSRPMGRRAWPCPARHDARCIAVRNPRSGDRTNKVRKSDERWRARLAPTGYAVTRPKATGRAFTGRDGGHREADKNRSTGCGTALFASEAGLDPDSGRASHFEPTEPAGVRARPARSRRTTRSEILRSVCDARPGHAFEKGLPPTGLSYRVDSAAMPFELRTTDNTRRPA